MARKNIFPKWSNRLPFYIVTVLFVVACFVVFAFSYWASPKNTDVGYRPLQPIPFSHRLHAGELGIDCRYCHYNVEKSPHATVPPTELCMNCHSVIKKDSPNILKLRESFANNKPIRWIKVHQLPDYTYFNHSRHVNSGVSCVTCHGRVDKMEVVHQVAPLSMSWCLDCHRAPEKYLRPKEFVTKMDWKVDNQLEEGLRLKNLHNIHPKEDCSTCHR